MSTRDLIDAIAAGDSTAIDAAFQSEMATRISARLDDMRQEVAQNMFSEAAGQHEVNYLKGHSAFKAGKKRRDNPFKDGSQGAAMWAKGWEHASDGKEPVPFTQVKEEIEDLEEMAWGAAKSKSGGKVEWHSMGDKHYVLKDGKPTHSGFLAHKDAAAEYKKHLGEEFEEVWNLEEGIDLDEELELDEELVMELSKGTLARYVQKAARDSTNRERDNEASRSHEDSIYKATNSMGNNNIKDNTARRELENAGYAARQALSKQRDANTSKMFKREMGMHRAIQKIAKEEFDLDLNEEQLDELSKTTLARYVKKAAFRAADSAYGSAASQNVSQLNKSIKRLSGIRKAVDKLAK